MQNCAAEVDDPAKVLSASYERSSTLCDALDRALNTGAVVVGDVALSVAGIDLIYLQLQLVLTSAETARRVGLDRTWNRWRERTDHVAGEQP